jgi:hypothetical protein
MGHGITTNEIIEITIDSLKENEIDFVPCGGVDKPGHTRCCLAFYKTSNGNFSVGFIKGGLVEANQVRRRVEKTGELLSEDFMTQAELAREAGLPFINQLKGFNGFAFYEGQTEKTAKALGGVAIAVSANRVAASKREAAQQGLTEMQSWKLLSTSPKPPKP